MISILEFLNRNKFENKIGNIVFRLDEESLELLDDEFKQILEDANYTLSYDIISESNRTIWTSKDGDELKIGDHANSRKNRPVEKAEMVESQLVMLKLLICLDGLGMIL